MREVRPKCKAWTGKYLRTDCSIRAATGALYCKSHRPAKYASKDNYRNVWCTWREEATTSEGLGYWIACAQARVKDADYCEGHLFSAALQMAQLELPLEAKVTQ